MKKLFAAILAMFVSVSVFAQEAFAVATGDVKAGSTYSKVFNEYAKACSPTLPSPLSEISTTGSLQNLQLLVDNKANAIVVQSDLLFFTRATDPAKVANIKTLVAMYPEELHFIARGDVKKEGGILGFGGTNVTFNTLNDVRGRVVGAVGGSVLSGRVVSSQSGLNFTVQEYPNNDSLKAALLEGKVDTILVVGGAPHALVSSLDTRYKLLSIPADLQKKLSGVYSATKLSYSNMNQAGIDSVTTQSLIVTRTYRSPAMQKQLAAMRSCFKTAALDLADKNGTHPKWQVIDVEDKGKWDWYELK